MGIIETKIWLMTHIEKRKERKEKRAKTQSVLKFSQKF